MTLTPAPRRFPAAWLAAVAGALALLSGLFALLVFSDTFHDLEHERLATRAQLDEVRPEQLVDELQSYFMSADRSLLTYSYLSHRERLHYLEVKDVMRTILGCFLVSTAVAVIMLAWMLAGARRRGEPRRLAIRKVMGNTAWILLTLIATGALLALDFDRSFLHLHHLLFEGPNWIMPTYSVTARVFPAQYFLDFFLVYCGLLLTVAVALIGAVAVVRR